MKRWLEVAVSMSILLALTACSSGPVRRVSEPAASIQQLTVRSDGSWSVDLRLQNYSSIPMRFGAIDLKVIVEGQEAGALKSDAGISIGPESADVVTIVHVPTADARFAIAGALGDRRGVSYALEGTLQAVPEDKKSRSFDIKRTNQLNPVPGLPGVLR